MPQTMPGVVVRERHVHSICAEPGCEAGLQVVDQSTGLMYCREHYAALKRLQRRLRRQRRQHLQRLPAS